jgi:hypothetical protein
MDSDSLDLYGERKTEMLNRQFKPIGRQAGLTFWGVLFFAALAVFTAYIVMQLVPVYTVNSSIKNAMELSLDDLNLRRATRAQVVRNIQQQLYLDGTSKALDYKRDLKIQRSREQFIIETSYYPEVPIFSNISLLVKFDNRVERDLEDN